MTKRIFICYRHVDDADEAARIYRQLELEFGGDLLFMDDRSIAHGADFAGALHEIIARSDVVLALIGPNWLGTRKEDGTRRLDDTNDYVRTEIATALQRNIRVIPVLLDGARIPTADELPDDLRGLARRNELHVRSATFQRDLESLVRGLKSSLGAAPPLSSVRYERHQEPRLEVEVPRRQEDEARRQEEEPRRQEAARPPYDPWSPMDEARPRYEERPANSVRAEVGRDPAALLNETSPALDLTHMKEMRQQHAHSSGTEDESGDLADFSIFAPPTATVKTEIFVQVMLHVAGDLAAARQRAAEVDDSAALRGTSTLEVPISNGSRVTVMLAFDGADVAIDRPAQTVTWSRQLVAINFLVKTPSAPKTIFPVVRVGCNGAIAGEMRFKLDVVARWTNPVGILQEPECKRYRRVFFSYSSQDRARVLEVAQSYRVLGVSFFQDILSLEPGQRWQQGLYKEIDICDLFLLFWSYASSRSEWVEKEARYALAQRTKSGDLTPDIVPLILDGPPPPAVPDFLSHLHFDDWMRYAIAATKARHSMLRAAWWLIAFGIILVVAYIYLRSGLCAFIACSAEP